MNASLKISQIESKISELQSQKQHLLEERQKEIAVLIATLGLTSLEDKVLIGGLQFLKHKITTQDPIVEVWHAAGERFLRRFKPQKHCLSQKTEQAVRKSQSSQKSS